MISTNQRSGGDGWSVVVSRVSKTNEGKLHYQFGGLGQFITSTVSTFSGGRELQGVSEFHEEKILWQAILVTASFKEIEDPRIKPLFGFRQEWLGEKKNEDLSTFFIPSSHFPLPKEFVPYSDLVYGFPDKDEVKTEVKP